ncbi:glutamate decarboxylase [Tanacetum coccineum]|uniref:glutamate decarboxylase n=1 Tax=Tanacetum coccineum TaxID=301880 RepID=A0ABQ4YAL5_9ASTR
MVTHLFNAPLGDSETIVGVGTVGSSEAIMLAGIAFKIIWQHKMRAAGKPFDKPNIVTGANVQVCWEKFARYFEVEVKEVKFSEGYYVTDPKNAVEMVDENILGSTVNGEFEDGLESHGSIVRQSTITRKKEVCSEGEYANGSVIDTNMIYLYHYVKQLGRLQRPEITKKDKTFFDNENNDMEVASGSDVSEERIVDFVHAIRAICDRLEKAQGDVKLYISADRSGYQQKDRKPSQNDKTEHGMEKTVQNQGQSPKMTKSESILKNQQSNRSRN